MTIENKIKKILETEGASESLSAQLYVGFVPTTFIKLKQLTDEHTKEIYKKTGLGNCPIESKASTILQYAALGALEVARMGAYSFLLYHIFK
jgi:hypothetical protein